MTVTTDGFAPDLPAVPTALSNAAEGLRAVAFAQATDPAPGPGFPVVILKEDWGGGDASRRSWARAGASAGGSAGSPPVSVTSRLEATLTTWRSLL